MTSPIITEAVRALVDRRDLTRIEAAAAMEAIMSGAATDAQIAAFLTGLRMKGETVEEIVGFAEAIRAAATPLPIDSAASATALDVSGTGRDALTDPSPIESSLIDTSGTGGDAS